MVVGDLVSMVEAVAGELLRHLERGYVPAELAGAHLLRLQLSYVHIRLMSHADVDARAAELRRSVDTVPPSLLSLLSDDGSRRPRRRCPSSSRGFLRLLLERLSFCLSQLYCLCEANSQMTSHFALHCWREGGMDNACLCNGGQIAIELCDWDRASNHETLRAISPEDSCEIPFGFRHWHPVRENFDETLSPTVQISFKNSTTSSGGAAGRAIDVVVPTPNSKRTRTARAEKETWEEEPAKRGQVGDENGR